MGLQFVTPVGRLVQGDVFTAQTKDKNGQPLTVKTGPNKGQPTQRYFMAIAVPKFVEQNGQLVQNQEFAQWYAALQAEGRAAYPQLFNAQGQCTHPRFAWKVADGDGVDNDGKPNSGKPGHAGHWIIKFGSSFAPKVLNSDGRYITEPSAIKRGYYVRVAGNAQKNEGSEVPGLYINHEAVELVAYGEEIKTGIDAVAVFGGTARGYVPPGASATPVAGAPMAQPAGLQPTAKAQGMSVEQWRASGWTDDQLIAQGIFTR